MTSWDIFVEELKEHMDGKSHTSPVTSRALSQALRVDVETVRNWRKGRARPALELIPEIARFLQMGANPALGVAWDPLYLPRKMQIVPSASTDVESMIDDVVRAQELQARVVRAQEASRTARSGAAALIAQRACDLGTWAVGVYPAIEGPPGFAMHVADRLSFLRSNGEPVKPGEVWLDFEEELRAGQAVFSSSRVWPRWAARTDSDEAHWAIPQVGAIRSSQIALPHPRIQCIAIVSLTVRSWANDVASHVADVLGYGQTSTRAIATDFTHEAKGNKNRVGRRMAHERLLEQRPAKRVWSHWDHQGPLTERTIPDGCWVVYLNESDALLSKSSPVRTGAVELNALLETKQAMLNRAHEQDGVAVVDLPLSAEPVRSVQWEMTFTALREILEWLQNEAGLTPGQILDQTFANPRRTLLLSWLEENGWAG